MTLIPSSMFYVYFFNNFVFTSMEWTCFFFGMVFSLTYASTFQPIYLTADDATQFIQYPGNPHDLSDGDVDYSWKISAQDSSRKVTIKIKSIQDSSCHTYWEVFDGPTKKGLFRGHSCKTITTITSTGNTMFLRFVANNGSTVSGAFQVKYFQVENEKEESDNPAAIALGICGGVLLVVVLVLISCRFCRNSPQDDKPTDGSTGICNNSCNNWSIQWCNVM